MGGPLKGGARPFHVMYSCRPRHITRPAQMHSTLLWQRARLDKSAEAHVDAEASTRLTVLPPRRARSIPTTQRALAPANESEHGG